MTTPGAIPVPRGWPGWVGWAQTKSMKRWRGRETGGLANKMQREDAPRSGKLLAQQHGLHRRVQRDGGQRLVLALVCEQVTSAVLICALLPAQRLPKSTSSSWRRTASGRPARLQPEVASPRQHAVSWTTPPCPSSLPERKATRESDAQAVAAPLCAHLAPPQRWPSNCGETTKPHASLKVRSVPRTRLPQSGERRRAKPAPVGRTSQVMTSPRRAPNPANT